MVSFIQLLVMIFLSDLAPALLSPVSFFLAVFKASSAVSFREFHFQTTKTVNCCLIRSHLRGVVALVVPLLPSLQQRNLFPLEHSPNPGFFGCQKGAELDIPNMTDKPPTSVTKREAQLLAFGYHVSEKKPSKIERNRHVLVIVARRKTARFSRASDNNQTALPSRQARDPQVQCLFATIKTEWVRGRGKETIMKTQKATAAECVRQD